MVEKGSKRLQRFPCLVFWGVFGCESPGLSPQLFLHRIDRLHRVDRLHRGVSVRPGTVVHRELCCQLYQLLERLRVEGTPKPKDAKAGPGFTNARQMRFGGLGGSCDFGIFGSQDGGKQKVEDHCTYF